MAHSKFPQFPPSKSRTLKKFKLFPKLPTEIRLMIWYFCLPGPRVVDVTLRRKATPTITGELLDYSRFISSVWLPMILRVCSESRKVARQHYKLAFSKSTKTESSPARIYIDFSKDIVWFDNLRYFPSSGGGNQRLVPKKSFAKIKYLAMRHCIDGVLLNTTRLVNPKFFPALEAIYVIDPQVYPCSASLHVYGQYTSEPLTEAWEKEKKCPVVYLACPSGILPDCAMDLDD
jgi:hypothetical protein